MLKVALVAGEVSGDLLAAGLMHELKLLSSQPVEFFGVGGELMQLEGLKTQFPMERLSLLGLGFDVVLAIPKLLWLRYKLIKAIIAFKPDVFIGIDAPDFNLYIEKSLKANQIKTIHYVSPSIWAWRYDRIFKIKKAANLVLSIFPMEAKYYNQELIPVKYVGHILADTIPLEIDSVKYKHQLGLAEYINVFSVLVGSRISEVKYLVTTLIATCNLIAQVIPKCVFLFPLHNNSLAKHVSNALANAKINFNYKVLINQTEQAIQASDLVLSKSGTVCLSVALYKKPLIVFYKVSWLNYFLFKNKLISKYFALPNIILDELVACEYLQEQANEINLSKAFIELYNDKNKQEYMIFKFQQLHLKLKQQANYKSAKAIIEVVNN